jgi:hypothetical protein
MQKNIRIGIIGAVLVVVSAFGVYWVQQYLQRSRASATAPTAELRVFGPKVNPGDSFYVILTINPNLTPFFSFDVAFTYDGTKLDLKATDSANLLTSITPLSTKPDGTVDITLLTGMGSTSVDPNSHTVRITGIRTTGASNPFVGRDPIEMVKIGFTLKPGAELPLDFKWIDPDPAKITVSDSFEKKDLHYTGVEPTVTPAPTGIGAVGVPTPTLAPGAVQPTLAYNSLTPVPTIIGGSGTVASTTDIVPRTDLLYINSIASYQSPFRYEQAMKLEKGNYALRMGAKVWVKRGRGMVLALLCNEATCGDKKKGESMYISPVFPAKKTFSEMSGTVTIPEAGDKKEYLLRIFCEDGSECEIDYISLEDAWGSERIINMQFQTVTKLSDPRKQPASWEVDSTANLYGSVDPAFGKNGALMINNSIK